MAVKWTFRADPSLGLPYQDNIAALPHEPTFPRAPGDAAFARYRSRPRLQCMSASARKG